MAMGILKKIKPQEGTYGELKALSKNLQDCTEMNFSKLKEYLAKLIKVDQFHANPNIFSLC